MKSLLVYLKNYKKESFFAPLFKMLEAIFELIVPLVVSSVIDNGILRNDYRKVLYDVGIMVVLAVVCMSVSVTAQYFAANYLRRRKRECAHVFSQCVGTNYSLLWACDARGDG